VVTDRLIRITTALAVLIVASAAAIISSQHVHELVTSHGETGFTARLLPFTVDGLIWAASMVACTRAAATTRYHAWCCAARALATWPRSAPTWRTAWATAPLARWSARGLPWPWLARSSC
jgi:hypothetical protein